MAMVFPEPKFYRLFEIEEGIDISFATGGPLTVTPVAKGSVRGEFLNGQLQPGGGRWDTQEGDAVKVDSKYIIKTTDGAIIMMNADGWKDNKGERVHLHFQTGSKKYDWLNHTIAVGRMEDGNGKKVLAAYAMLNAAAPKPKQQPADLKVEHLYYVEVNVMEQMESGKYEGGKLLVIPIKDGHFEGKKLNGTVECVGADYNVLNNSMPVRSHITTRYILTTNDGSHISLVTDGRLYINMKGVMAMMKQTPDAVDLGYFRQHLMFTTGDERYSWLNHDICFAVIGMGQDRIVRYQAYAMR